MTETVQLFLALGLTIGFAKAMGYLAYRLHQPAVLGELLAGVLIGPTVLDLLGNAALFPDGKHVTTTLIEIAEIGVLLLMCMAGMEVDLYSLLTVRKPAFWAGFLGVLAPLVVITPAVMLFGYPMGQALFMGILFASMSTSISAQVMLELGVLRRREGMTLLGAALIDDAIVILLLSIFLAVNPGGVVIGAETRPIWEVLLRIFGFLVVGFAVCWVAIPKLLNLVSGLRIAEGSLMVVLVSIFIISFLAEYIGGIAAITGAFMVGVSIRRARHKAVETVERGLHALNYAFLVPLFFVSIGLQANLRLMDMNLLPFAIVITVLAILTKVVGASGGTRLAGFDPLASLRVGLGMISRGEVGLIVASIGIGYGILSSEIFTVVVFVVLITTLITPPLVRWSFMVGRADTSPTPSLPAALAE